MRDPGRAVEHGGAERRRGRAGGGSAGAHARFGFGLGGRMGDPAGTVAARNRDAAVRPRKGDEADRAVLQHDRLDEADPRESGSRGDGQHHRDHDGAGDDDAALDLVVLEPGQPRAVEHAFELAVGGGRVQHAPREAGHVAGCDGDARKVAAGEDGAREVGDAGRRRFRLGRRALAGDGGGELVRVGHRDPPGEPRPPAPRGVAGIGEGQAGGEAGPVCRDEGGEVLRRAGGEKEGGDSVLCRGRPHGRGGPSLCHGRRRPAIPSLCHGRRRRAIHDLGCLMQ